tara:strand:- start:6 stop:1910 length:1905 start_codon:yes stop_codon:yes gene_type:complete
MSKSFSLNQLTEGIRQRNLGGQNKQLVEKWSRTGLLRGLNGVHRENMARLLENQAGQVLKEASSVSTGGGNLASSGDLRGFTNIAFPIVRRVFGGLIANELVSIQPMSLPSGLLFYLDYTYGSQVGGVNDSRPYTTGSSIYNAPTGKGVRSGSLAVGGQYDLAGTGYTRVHDSVAFTATSQLLLSGAVRGTNNAMTAGSVAEATGSDGKLLQFDPQIAGAIEGNTTPGGNAGPGVYSFVVIETDSLTNIDKTMIKEVALVPDVAGTLPSGLAVIGDDTNGNKIQDGDNLLNVRRLNRLGTVSGNSWTSAPLADISDANTGILMVVSGAIEGSTAEVAKLTVSFPVEASLNSGTGDTLVIPAFESDFATSPSPNIPEIDIKIEAIAVVANTRKLRAKWSPELAQDLNAYHSLDAEVELTQILSEQIALEIDREILNDLLMQGNAANYFWSRAPGKFVNKETGSEVLASGTNAPGPAFRGTVREWYETLVETCIDVGNQIHRKTLRGSANFVVVGPDVATILEASVFYKPSYTLDGDGQVGAPMVIGAEKVGTLSNRFTVYKDPYFPRNKVLVGYKGGSYLETGYVYAPYVPLIVTPTIFAPEDFTPRKGVMTRYGKKMVRSDFYGTVTCLDMNVI